MFLVEMLVRHLVLQVRHQELGAFLEVADQLHHSKIRIREAAFLARHNPPKIRIKIRTPLVIQMLMQLREVYLVQLNHRHSHRQEAYLEVVRQINPRPKPVLGGVVQ